jgi:lysophospholipid acyltransferase
VQSRVVKPGTRATPKDNMIVYMVSAFWHGFYPFYYVMFFFTAIFAEISKDIYRSRILFSGIPPKVRYFMCWFLMFITMNYLAISFNQLTFEKGGNFARSTNYFVYISLIVVFVAFRFSGIVQYAQKKQKVEDAKKVKKDL